MRFVKRNNISISAISLCAIALLVATMVEQGHSFSVQVPIIATNQFLLLVPKRHDDIKVSILSSLSLEAHRYNNSIRRKRQNSSHERCSRRGGGAISLYAQKSSNHNPNPDLGQRQKKGKGYQQIGGPIADDLCTLSEGEIIKFIKERTKERRNQNFQKADEILVTLKQHFVFVNDSTKQWRADGQSFVYSDGQQQQQQQQQQQNTGYDSGNDYVYTKARNSKYISDRDEEYIKNKLKERYIAKLNRDYNTADDIVDELRYIKNIQVDDEKKTFRAVDPFKLEYTFGGKRINNIHPDLLREIEDKVKARAKAKSQKDYAKADEILEDLTIGHGVRVDDMKKEWHFMRKKSEARNHGDKQQLKNNDNRDKGESRRKSQQEKKAVDHNISSPSDWSIVDDSSASVKTSKSTGNDEVIPGVSLVEIPEGIVIDDHPPADRQREEISVPDGIVIDDDIVEDEPSLNSHQDSIDHYEELIPNKNELESLTVPLLKEKLRSKGLPVSGRKMELIDRLINGR